MHISNNIAFKATSEALTAMGKQIQTFVACLFGNDWLDAPSSSHTQNKALPRKLVMAVDSGLSVLIPLLETMANRLDKTQLDNQS